MKARVINGFNRNDQPPTIKPTGDRQWAGALLLLIYVALVPSLAHAGPIESGVDWLLDLLTNGIARSVAIIALAILGYMAFAGKLTLEAAVKFMAGIVLIFGGATLVDTFVGAVS